jgi:DsbC/DsbD-like thiol-disulfide interchange protein
VNETRRRKFHRTHSRLPGARRMFVFWSRCDTLACEVMQMLSIVTRSRHIPRPAALLALLLAVATPAAGRAQDASPWDADQRSALRLIAGSSGSGVVTLRAGLQMRIDPGWKTYWRYAGDSGLPPSFDFSGSENVKSVVVLFPAPRRFPDGAGGSSIGYAGDVIFPLQVIAQDAQRPVTLRVKVDYGVCERICVPAHGKAELRLTGGTSSEDTTLTDAEERVPKPATLGAPGPLVIRSARRETSSTGQRVVVTVSVPEGATADLFAEGPTPQWALPLPEPLDSGTGATRRFAFAVDGVPPGERIAAVPLRFTLTSGDSAIEVTTHLD